MVSPFHGGFGTFATLDLDFYYFYFSNLPIFRQYYIVISVVAVIREHFRTLYCNILYQESQNHSLIFYIYFYHIGILFII